MALLTDDTNAKKSDVLLQSGAKCANFFRALDSFCNRVSLNKSRFYEFD